MCTSLCVIESECSLLCLCMHAYREYMYACYRRRCRCLRACVSLYSGHALTFERRTARARKERKKERKEKEMQGKERLTEACSALFVCFHCIQCLFIMNTCV